MIKPRKKSRVKKTTVPATARKGNGVGHALLISSQGYHPGRLSDGEGPGSPAAVRGERDKMSRCVRPCQQLTEAKATFYAPVCQPGPSRLHCAQAVLRFALLVADLDPDLVVAARYLGGGVARMGETCGVLTGAALALGLRDCQDGGLSVERMAPTSTQVQDLHGPSQPNSARAGAASSPVTMSALPRNTRSSGKVKRMSGAGVTWAGCATAWLP